LQQRSEFLNYQYQLLGFFIRRKTPDAITRSLALSQKRQRLRQTEEPDAHVPLVGLEPLGKPAYNGAYQRFVSGRIERISKKFLSKHETGQQRSDQVRSRYRKRYDPTQTPTSICSQPCPAG
jgi:hypothetical protein